MSDVEAGNRDLAAQLSGVSAALAELLRGQRLATQRAREFARYDAYEFYNYDKPVVAGHAVGTAVLSTDEDASSGCWGHAMPQALAARVWLKTNPDAVELTSRIDALKRFVNDPRNDVDSLGVVTLTPAEKKRGGDYYPTRVCFEVQCEYGGAHKYWDEMVAIALDAAAAMDVPVDADTVWVTMCNKTDRWMGRDLDTGTLVLSASV